MQSYYMRADLHSLIEDLKRYASEEEIMKFINNLDLINLLAKGADKSLFNLRDGLSNVMREVSAFLVHINIEKYKETNIELYNLGQYDAMAKSKEDFITFISKTIDEIPDSFTFYNRYEFEFSIRGEEYMNMFNKHIDEAWESIEKIKNSRNI